MKNKSQKNLTFYFNIYLRTIEDMIYEISCKQVMLDSDLAQLYQCSNGTKSINLAVKRHINRFPERFMFQLTKEEYYHIPRFQVETLYDKVNRIGYKMFSINKID